MARFDLHRIRGQVGFLLVVQHRMHDDLPTRVVVPLLPSEGPLPAFRGLTPQMEIEGKRYTIFPQYVAAIPKRELGKPVGNLEAQRDAITKALDVLFTGF